MTHHGLPRKRSRKYYAMSGQYKKPGVCSLLRSGTVPKMVTRHRELVTSPCGNRSVRRSRSTQDRVCFRADGDVPQ